MFYLHFMSVFNSYFLGNNLLFVQVIIILNVICVIMQCVKILNILVGCTYYLVNNEILCCFIIRGIKIHITFTITQFKIQMIVRLRTLPKSYDFKCKLNLKM